MPYAASITLPGTLGRGLRGTVLRVVAPPTPEHRGCLAQIVQGRAPNPGSPPLRPAARMLS